VFLEKRLQAIENKGNEGIKEGKERANRRQSDVKKRVAAFEDLKAGPLGTLSGYTPVVTERVRKLLEKQGIAMRRCVKESVSA
jgi:hypothetical protein